MSADLGLAPLLTALREAGLQVGITEVTRLQRLFALKPDADRERLRSLLRAVLVKSGDDRAAFERIFTAWFERADWARQALAAVPSPTLVRPVRVVPRNRQSVKSMGPFMALLALAVLSLVIGSHVVLPERELLPQGDTSQVQPGALETVAPLRPLTPAEIRKRKFKSWVPTITIEEAETETILERIFGVPLWLLAGASPRWHLWPGLGFGLLALATAGGLWLELRRRRFLPEPEPLPSLKGPPRVFLPPPSLPGFQFLDLREQEGLVWGIGRFITNEPTPRLNLSATVLATAKAVGVPQPIFLRARHHREVWLWVDEAAEDPVLPRIAGEIERVLLGHGLPVERAAFRGMPYQLLLPGQAPFAPAELDERRDAALVAILTDGRLLVRQYATDDRRVRLDALLRGLSHWPNLAFVDFSDGGDGFREILAQYGIDLITPASLATFLGGGVSRQARATSFDDASWAAVCALAPTSVDEAIALDLRRRLHLATSPWALRSLRSEAPGPPGRLAWASHDRARRVNWLREAEVHPDGAVAPGSLLGRALAEWERLYEEEIHNAALEGTPAHQSLRMERALLQLWGQRASEAIRELYQIFQGALREMIRYQLGTLAPAGMGGVEHIRLPWNWLDRPPVEKAMLHEMGLGGGMAAVHLQWPGRAWIGVGVCLGMAISGLILALVPFYAGAPVIRDASQRPLGAFVETSHPNILGVSLKDQWDIVAASKKESAFTSVGPGARVTIHWDKRDLSCVETFGDVEIWRCGAYLQAPSIASDIRRSVIGLQATSSKEDAESLAISLLDSGSADVVIFAENGERFKDVVAGRLGTVLGQQEYFVQRAPWAALEESLMFDGVKTLAQAWPQVVVETSNSALRLRGSGVLGCRSGAQVEITGLTFNLHCLSGISPEYAVVVEPGIWISEKVTNSQYQQVQSAHPYRDHRPVIGLEEIDAQLACPGRSRAINGDIDKNSIFVLRSPALKDAAMLEPFLARVARGKSSIFTAGFRCALYYPVGEKIN